jgi:hypothetical protein
LRVIALIWAWVDAFETVRPNSLMRRPRMISSFARAEFVTGRVCLVKNFGWRFWRA